MTGISLMSAAHLPATLRLEQFVSRAVALLSAALVVWLWALPGFAATPATTPATPNPPPAPLPVDDAFMAAASFENGDIVVRFDVLPGHYLFRDRFEFQRDGEAVKLIDAFKQNASVVGKTKKDPTFGDVKVFEQSVSLNAGHTARAKTQLVVTFQGCSEVAGVCYPPTRRTFALTNGARGVSASEVEKPGLSKLFKKQVSQ
jgi:thiol:disulfide interchange protein